MAFSLLLITACYSPVTQKPNIATAKLAISECRVIQHKLGETCVPFKPQRIIALEDAWILDPLLALGIKPVGIAILKERFFYSTLADAAAEIELVGTTQQPSFEKILMLKPDLILSLDAYGGQNYELLSAIAPTVPIEFDKAKLSFKDNFRFIAQLVGQENKVEQVLNQYQKRIKELQRLLGARLKEMEVSIIEWDGGNFTIQGRYIVYLQLLNDIGIRILPTLLDKNEAVTLNIEVLNEYDADILFIVNVDGNKKLSSYLQKPPISLLKAVKNNRAYIVETNIWWPYGPLGVNRLLDELPKYLLGDDINSSKTIIY